MPKKTLLPPLAPAVKAWRDTIKPLKLLGISLFDQQLWCWGYDIRQAGNLLLRYGFTQYRQDKSCGGTAYSINLDDGGLLRLWGGNVGFHLDGLATLHLKRYEFEPRLLPRESVMSFAPPDTSGFAVTPADCLRAAQLGASCMRWIAGYERWVVGTVGIDHRGQAVKAWKQNAVFLIDAEQMSALWDESAVALERYVAEWGELVRDD